MSDDTAAASRPAATTGPRSRKGARTRARLVEAAKEVFAEHGLPDARIADIVERAGLSYGVFYHYFESKEALFREIAHEIGARLHAPVDEVILQRGSSTAPEDRLRQALRRYFEAYRDDAPILGVIEQAARLDDEVRVAREGRDRAYAKQVADSIRLLQRRGLADPDLDPDIASAALGAMTSRFAELWLAQGRLDCDLETGVETVTRLFTNALGIPRAR